MSKIEKRLERQDFKATRTLSPAALERVILRITSYGAQPLTRDGANAFSRTLHRNERKGSCSVLTYKDRAYYLDFNALEGDEAATNLTCAVAATDKALLAAQPFAEISGAWMIAADGPPVGQISPSWEETATDITGSAQELFARQRNERIEAAAKHIMPSLNFDSLLFQSS